MPKSITRGASTSAKKAPPVLLLDTHIAVWLAETNSRLNSSTLALIEEAFHHGTLNLSAISAWEIALLVSQNKLDLGQPPQLWFEGFAHRFSINVIDVTAEIAINSSYLPGKIHRDPADRILVSTALHHSAAIVTADKQIASYGKQGFIRVIRC